MKIALKICLALLICGAVMARPKVIESNHAVMSAESTAHHGDQLVRVQWKRLPNPPEGGQLWRIRVIVHERTAWGTWPNLQTLWTETFPYDISGIGVAMNASTIAVAMPNGIRIFERGRFHWQEAALDMPVRPTGWVLDLSGNDILTREVEEYGQPVMISRGADGVWRQSAQFAAPAGWAYSSFDADGDRLIFSLFRPLTTPSTAVEIHERNGGSWGRVAHIEGHGGEGLAGSFGPMVGINGSLALVSGFESGLHVLQRGSAGDWWETGHWQNPGSGRHDGAGQFQITDDHVLRAGVMRHRNATGLYLYKRLPDGGFQHLANLVGNQYNHLERGTLSLAGNRVLASTNDGMLMEYDLPQSFEVPPLLQYDAEDADISRWTVLPASDFYIADIGVTSVYRQASVEFDAGAIHDAVLESQSIAADVRVNQFNGAIAWAGLVTRYNDDLQNFHVRLDNSGKLALMRAQLGGHVELAAVNIGVSTGHTFHLRLESSGSHHAVYVDGQQVMEAHDLAFPMGRTGIKMDRAAADYDNIVISPGPTTEMVFSDVQTIGGSWVDADPLYSNERDFSQQDATAAEALRLAGHSSQDQSVQALLTVNQFSEPASSAGVIARYEDANNYWFAIVNGQNQLSLKRKRNGVITNISTIPLTVRAGRPVVLRLDMVREKVRVFANGVLRMERSNAGLASGKAGLLTSRASARIEAYTADEL